MPHWCMTWLIVMSMHASEMLASLIGKGRAALDTRRHLVNSPRDFLQLLPLLSLLSSHLARGCYHSAEE